jgi:hypothetical protein
VNEWTTSFSAQERFPAYPGGRREAPIMRGVAAERSAERACERSSDWRRGARRAPPTRSFEYQRKHASFRHQRFSFQVYLP